MDHQIETIPSSTIIVEEKSIPVEQGISISTIPSVSVIEQAVDEGDNVANIFAPTNTNNPQMPEYTTWAEIGSLPLEEPVEYIKDLVTEGFTLVVGKPKQGKSTLMCAIALSIASGKKAFGELEVRQSEVAILALETSPRRFQKDINRVPKEYRTAFSRIRTIFTWNPDLALYSGLTSFLKKHPEIRVLIIDTLGRFLGTSGGTSSGYEKRYQTGAILKNIADEFNMAIIGLHHLRKGNTSDDPVDSIMGSTGLPAAADNIITLRRSRTTGIATLDVTGRNIDENQFQLKFIEETRSFELIKNHSEITLGREAQRALDFLNISGEIKTLAEIGEFLGKGKTAVSNLLKILVDRGMVVKSGHGLYQAANKLVAVIS